MTESKMQTPVAAVGVLVLKEKRVLLIKRKQPPNQHYWVIPGGKIRLGESMQSAAEREVKEETGINIKAGLPIYAFDHIEVKNGFCIFHYIIVDLSSEYVSGDVNPASDALDAKWFFNAELAHESIEINTTKFLAECWHDK